MQKRGGAGLSVSGFQQSSRVSGFQTFRRSGFHGFKINRQSDICIQFQTGNFRKQVCLPRLQTASVCNQESDSTRKQPIIGQPPPAALKSDSRARVRARARAHFRQTQKLPNGKFKKTRLPAKTPDGPRLQSKIGQPPKTAKNQTAPASSANIGQPHAIQENGCASKDSGQHPLAIKNRTAPVSSQTSDSPRNQP